MKRKTHEQKKKYVLRITTLSAPPSSLAGNQTLAASAFLFRKASWLLSYTWLISSGMILTLWLLHREKKFNFAPLKWGMTVWLMIYMCVPHKQLHTRSHTTETFLDYRCHSSFPSRTILTHLPSGKRTVSGTSYHMMILEQRHNFISAKDSPDTWIQWGLTEHL